jgi:uncharacterized phage protein (TIGR01671 family)
MNREFKFRVWYPKEKKFYYTSFEQAYGILGKDAWKEEYIIQQYTGLIDKNAKDIYEGDLITITGDVEGREPCSPTHKETSCPLEVFWDENWNGWRARFIPSYNTDIYERHDLPRSYESHHLEVVGNMFENLETLKWAKYIKTKEALPAKCANRIKTSGQTRKKSKKEI